MRFEIMTGFSSEIFSLKGDKESITKIPPTEFDRTILSVVFGDVKKIGKFVRNSYIFSKPMRFSVNFFHIFVILFRSNKPV